MTSSASIGEVDGLPALVVLEGGWRDEYLSLVEEHDLAVLSIRVTGADLSFLRKLTHLRGLVLNATEVRDLSVLSELVDLETLTLNVPTRPRLTLDLAAFPRLTRIALYWNPGFGSLFACPRLERSFVFSPPDADLERFAELRSLRRLELSQGRRLARLRGVGRLEDLAFLGLYHQSTLEDLADVGRVGSLRELAIESCKRLRELDEISTLTQLRSLKVADCGEIAGLRPLAGLRGLETFVAWGSTKVADGDLAILLELPHLRQVAMMDRRGYSPSVAEVQAVLARRGGGGGA